MMTLSRFIAIMIRNRDAVRELEHMGQRDQMTGLMNRRGFSHYSAPCRRAAHVRSSLAMSTALSA
ncbi:hypothetical protein, partial [Mitsuokella sp.]|uniref:hypothetical protein n=1 Tax=Mitsuokella sp. TaxID=2049034 RepID=UPI002A824EC2